MRKLRWLVLLLLCSPCFGAWANVNKTSNTCVAGTTCAVSYTPAASTNLVRVLVLFNTSGSAMAVPTTNGSGGTAFAWAKESDCNNGSTFRCGEAYTCNIGTGVTTITLNFPANDVAAYIIDEKSGNATSNCNDVNGAQATGSGTTATATSFTTTGSSDLVCGFFIDTANGAATFSTNGSWTLRQTQTFSGGGAALGTTEQLGVAAGPYSPAATVSAADAWVAEGTSYKAAASSAGPNVGFTGKTGIKGKVGII